MKVKNKVEKTHDCLQYQFISITAFQHEHFCKSKQGKNEC